MNTQELVKQYQEWELKLSAYTLALSTMGFDSRTIAPTNGSAYRNKRNAYLVGEYFSIVNDEEIFDVMKQLSTKEDLDEETKRAITYRLADIAKINCMMICKSSKVFKTNLSHCYIAFIVILLFTLQNYIPFVQLSCTAKYFL
jgi:Zn-dependent M32 family carboxypeptidase